MELHFQLPIQEQAHCIKFQPKLKLFQVLCGHCLMNVVSGTREMPAPVSTSMSMFSPSITIDTSVIPIAECLLHACPNPAEHN